MAKIKPVKPASEKAAADNKSSEAEATTEATRKTRGW